jgi:hypothetical protein
MQSNGGIISTETELLNLSMMNFPKLNRLKISHPPFQISLRENPLKSLQKFVSMLLKLAKQPPLLPVVKENPQHPQKDQPLK